MPVVTSNADEAGIPELLNELVDAWNLGDAKALARVIALMPHLPM